MRLWIDVREACRERKTGKGQWTLRAVEALLERGDVRATLVTDAEIPAAWRGLPGFAGVRMIPSMGMWWHLRAWRLVVWERSEIDVYLSPTSFIVPFLLGGAVPAVPVVHDLIAFKNEPHDRKATFIERLTVPRALRTALEVCCVSEATATLVHAKFRGVTRTFVAGAGPTVAERGTWTGGGGHILSIGTLCPRKNQLRLIRAFASLPSDVRGDTKLALVGGRGWEDDEIVRLASSTPGVTWMGFQSSEECSRLLRTCRAFTYVSEDEGFGLPVLDALRVGAPVLASDIPTNREVAGDAATYCDPLDELSIANALATVLASPRAPDPAAVDRFTWEATAERIVGACSAR